MSPLPLGFHLLHPLGTIGEHEAALPFPWWGREGGVPVLFIVKENPHRIHWESDASLLGVAEREVSLLTGAARALPARQRKKKIQVLILQQTLNKGEEEEG